MSKVSYPTLEKFLSHPRLERFLYACQNDKNKAVELYKANLEISKSFYPLINITEVVLRNQINNVLTSHFSDPNWILNQRYGFMFDLSLKTGNFFMKTQIDRAEIELRKRNVPISSGRVIAELNFYFWTMFFENQHYKLLKGRPIKIFPNIPAKHGKLEVWSILTKIRKLRNRISHQEPICFNNRTSKIDFSLTIDVYKSIRKITRWIDSDLLIWVKETDSVISEIKKAKSFL
jgi:Abi-like protein